MEKELRPTCKRKPNKHNKGRHPTRKKKVAHGIIGMNIDRKEFEKLASYHCTMTQIASFFDVYIKTLENWIKAEYKTDDTRAVVAQFKEKGKATLIKTMFDEAIENKNTNLMIWLSKNHLNYTDKQQTTIDSDCIKVVANVEKEK